MPVESLQRSSPVRPMPFALCLNGQPIARVQIDHAIESVASLLSLIRGIIGETATDFTIELRRFDPFDMDLLPPSVEEVPLHIIACLFAQQAAEGNQ